MNKTLGEQPGSIVNDDDSARRSTLPTDTPPSFLEKPAPATEREETAERSILQLYLQEIGKTPLLTIAEEVRLAKRILKGDKAARDHMIQANLRLFVKIAHYYKDFGLPLLDFIIDGNICLIKVVGRSDTPNGTH